MPEARPIYLKLTEIQMPVTAVTSILHRVSGVLIFLGLPFLLWLFAQVMSGEAAFQAMQSLMSSLGMRFLMWVILSAVGYHLLAGLRHLLMDFGFWINQGSAKLTAWILLLLELGVVVGSGWKLLC